MPSGEVRRRPYCSVMIVMTAHMRGNTHTGESDERYVSARDCLEKFIMTKLGVYAFKSVEDPAEDAMLLRRMKLLSFLEPSVRTNEFCVQVCRLCSVRGCRRWISNQSYAMIWCGVWLETSFAKLIPTSFLPTRLLVW